MYEAVILILNRNTLYHPLEYGTGSEDYLQLIRIDHPVYL